MLVMDFIGSSLFQYFSWFRRSGSHFRYDNACGGVRENGCVTGQRSGGEGGRQGGDDGVSGTRDVENLAGLGGQRFDDHAAAANGHSVGAEGDNEVDGSMGFVDAAGDLGVRVGLAGRGFWEAG